MSVIKLKSSDGEVFPVDVEVAKQSVTIRTMLEDLGMEDLKEMSDEEAVPLPNVEASILKMVIEWAQQHKDDKPESSLEEDEKEKQYNDLRTDNIPEWDQGFLKVDQTTLFDIILAANYLDIKELMNLTCKTVANMIKGKTPAEVREHFGIAHDLTPEEEEQIIKENEEHNDEI